MTIPALLRHHGVTVPRFVTVDGRIVFNDVTATGAGDHLHSTFGPVTPVSSHTFHGGVEEFDAADGPPIAWWADENQISRHVNAMEGSFPNFRYLPPGAGVNPCWVGVIDTGRGRFQIAVILRKDGQLPRVTVLGGVRLGVSAGRRWQPSPHLYDNGNLCVADNNDWNPEEHTVATVTGWAAHWLSAYTEWRMTRRWPVEGVHLEVA
ncbi:hypothetical protein [Arthrobacter sp. NicSoilC5]|uniref:hypothetical protein n=1 Tax=Arthrobacter sp. NicSoilC5 TaxID=2831000 RepID=UPI001CC47A5F|nr:hypothetical protein [Arthrobacter sp. NicSoilC5]BCW78909.1 hypothetical protein NicSoilC5_09280 [Arthrobacter sp. NicSoilC5]